MRTEIEAKLLEIFGLGNIRPINIDMLRAASGVFSQRLGFGGTALAATLYATGSKDAPEVQSGFSPYGLYYDNGWVKFPLGVFKREYDGKFCLHIIAHEGAGEQFAFQVTEFASKVTAGISDIEVYTRYVSHELLAHFTKSNWQNAINRPWIIKGDKVVESEDEKFPQRLANIGHFRISANCRSNISRVIKKLGGSNYVLELLTDHEQAMDVIEKHFALLKNPVGSSADDYRSLIAAAIELAKQKEAGVHAYMGFLDGKPVSVFIGQEYEPGKLALYANITKYAEYHNLPLYAHTKLFELLRGKGIEFVNLGGSETKTLDDNKRHVAKLEGAQTYWVNYCRGSSAFCIDPRSPA